MPTGKVIWFERDRGFGFIAPDDGSPDLFVHYSSVVEPDADGRRNLVKDDRVQYEVGRGQDDREQAENVEVIA